MLMNALQIVSFILVALAAPAVVFTRDLIRQALILSIYGLLLTVLFLVLQAPDVALSELTVGAATVPLILLVTVARIRERERERAQEDGQ
jgi:uncharacterized MnhB-related membrane protein